MPLDFGDIHAAAIHKYFEKFGTLATKPAIDLTESNDIGGEHYIILRDKEGDYLAIYLLVKATDGSWDLRLIDDIEYILLTMPQLLAELNVRQRRNIFTIEEMNEIKVLRNTCAVLMKRHEQLKGDELQRE